MGHQGREGNTGTLKNTSIYATQNVHNSLKKLYFLSLYQRGKS